jgi:hypothetical protein
MSAARIGGPRNGRNKPTTKEVATAMPMFEEADRLLLSPGRMRPYSGMWVAAVNGDILADTDLQSLTNQLRERGVSLHMVAIRFIEKDGMAAA